MSEEELKGSRRPWLENCLYVCQWGKKSNKNVIQTNKSVSFNKCRVQVKKKIKLTQKYSG